MAMKPDDQTLRCDAFGCEETHPLDHALAGQTVSMVPLPDWLTRDEDG